ncbi:hypothetical protein [Halostella sp. PRR32]|uniref:hypothetical protein n=1 Tax=Halostella sp. PRR32 TaxID=3098147 RepID=UPI002B1E547F|nr:hypothetical protein [Halostella sp. PRR32]
MAAPDSTTRLADRPRVDSNWWYVVAVTPLFSLLLFLVTGWMVAAVLLGFGGGLMPMMGHSGTLAGIFTLLIPVFLFGTVGTVLTAVFPISLYLDAKAVRAADIGWDPDPVLYALVAVVGIVSTAFAFGIPLSLYYLYQRHRHVGTP